MRHLRWRWKSRRRRSSIASSAERRAKRLLTFHGEGFRRTHDLKELGEQCALLQPPLTPIPTEAASLTDYAIAYRYLDACGESDETEAAAWRLPGGFMSWCVSWWTPGRMGSVMAITNSERGGVG